LVQESANFSAVVRLSQLSIKEWPGPLTYAPAFRACWLPAVTWLCCSASEALRPGDVLPAPRGPGL